MQSSRLFEILYLLMARGTLTARELAQRLEVSVRTIYRDIDTLSSAGVPLYTAKGKGGGISLLEGAVLNRTVLTGEEQDQILLALQSLRAAGQPTAGDVLGRLSALFGKTEPAWIEVDFSRWGAAGQDQPKFQLLRQAVVQRRVLAFDYIDAQGRRSRRQVCPVKLIFRAKAWYLQAFCRSRLDYRTFKVDRMGQLALEEEHFDPLPPPPPLEVPAGPDYPLVRLRLEGEEAARCYEDFWPGEVTRQPDGALLVETHLPVDRWLVGYVLSYGGRARVLGPEELRQAVGRAAEKILQDHPNN